MVLRARGVPLDQDGVFGLTGMEPARGMGATTRELGYFTSDTKLGTYNTYSAELQLKWRLTFFRGSGPLSQRLRRTVIELTGGMWFADQAVGNQFGIPFSSGDPRGPAGCSLLCGAGYASLGLYIPL